MKSGWIQWPRGGQARPWRAHAPCAAWRCHPMLPERKPAGTWRAQILEDGRVATVRGNVQARSPMRVPRVDVRLLGVHADELYALDGVFEARFVERRPSVQGRNTRVCALDEEPLHNVCVVVFACVVHRRLAHLVRVVQLHAAPGHGGAHGHGVLTADATHFVERRLTLLVTRVHADAIADGLVNSFPVSDGARLEKIDLGLRRVLLDGASPRDHRRFMLGGDGEFARGVRAFEERVL
mmetsp:Transcript_17180/g.49844  ORF Transcript_17180/g.49844 Transcript_17180/m.49844 type:complete len:238 (-) Transcript_17180:533-1246(-)